MKIVEIQIISLISLKSQKTQSPNALHPYIAEAKSIPTISINQSTKSRRGKWYKNM